MKICKKLWPVGIAITAGLFGVYQTINHQQFIAKLPGCQDQLYRTIHQNSNITTISKDILECESFINHHFEPYQLTSIHWAVISNNVAALNLLHEQNAAIDPPDIVGFTPLHHAALKGNMKSVDLLLTWGANPRHQNEWGGTYADLLRFQNKLSSQPESSFKHSQFFTAHHIDPVEIHPECHPQEEVKYTQENLVSSDLLMKSWKSSASTLMNETPEDRQIRKNNPKFIEYQSKYEEYTRSPPPLLIAPIKELNGGCGVFAKSLIPKETIITEYVGKILPTNSKITDAKYLMKLNKNINIDGGKYRSAGGMLNMGFPNAFGYSCSSFDPECEQDVPGIYGFPFTRLTFKASRDIKPGEQIVVNYGNNYLDEKTLPNKNFRELNPKDRNTFAKNNLKNFKDILKTLNGEPSELYKMLLAVSEQERKKILISYTEPLKYIFETPFSLDDLVKDGIWTHEEFDLMYKLALKFLPDTRDLVEVNFESARRYFNT